MVDRKDKPWTVYRATCLVSKKSYIGVTSTSEAVRWAAHLRDVRNGRRESAFHLAIRKYGAETFVREILYVCVNWREAIAVERGLIAQYGTLTPNGYNISIGGEGHIGAAYKERVVPEAHKEHLRRLASAMKGKKKSPEAIEKLRASQMGHRGYFRGKSHTPETIEKMRAAAKSRWRDECQREKARSVVRTPEQKERMGAGQAKDWADPERKAARLQKSMATREATGYSHSEVMKRRYRDDPEWRERQGEMFRANWKDEKIRARMINARTRKRVD